MTRHYAASVASLEDKIVQRALTGVLNAVYEADFPGFSYGFRPGRSPHKALDALTAGIYRKKVSWVPARISATSSAVLTGTG